MSFAELLFAAIKHVHDWLKKIEEGKINEIEFP